MVRKRQNAKIGAGEEKPWLSCLVNKFVGKPAPEHYGGAVFLQLLLDLTVNTQ